MVNCPKCGSGLIRYRETGFHGVALCQCYCCDFQWLTPIKSLPPFDMEREIRSLWENYAVYAIHGVVAWAMASVLHLLLSVRNPWTVIVSLGSGWLPLVLWVGGMGIMLGLALSTALLISGAWFPRTPAIHFIFPLLCASILGAIQGLLWGHPAFVFSSAGILLRNAVIRMISGMGLAMCCTPVIIVRSAGVLRRRGLRPPLKARRTDPRWLL